MQDPVNQALTITKIRSEKHKENLERCSDTVRVYLGQQLGKSTSTSCQTVFLGAGRWKQLGTQDAREYGQTL